MSETAEKRNEEMLRSGRKVLLLTAGYTETEVAGSGDLAKLPAESVRELLHRKTVEAEVVAANPVIRKGARSKRLSPRSRRR